MTVVLAVTGAALLALFGGLGRAALRALGDLSDTIARAFDASEGSVRAEIRALEDLVDRLPQRWEEIQKEASRLDARARYHVKRVREELAERGLYDETIEDIDQELRPVDGERGRDGGMHALPESVASVPGPDERAPRSEEDYLTLARRRKFGAA